MKYSRLWRRLTTLVLGISVCLMAKSQNVYLKGTVETRDRQRIQGISIAVPETRSKTVSDAKGHFLLRGLPQREFVVQLRSEDSLLMETKFSHPEQDTIFYTFTLPFDAQKLEEVVVSSTRLHLESDDIGKVKMKNMENPEVYSYVSKELLKETNIVNIQDALRNVTGATVNMDPAGGISIMSRGFATYVGARNGYPFRATARSNTDLVNIEAIEVLKGPSGALFGNAVNSYGGLVNLVTKKPFESTQTEISYTVGSFGLQRLTADVNTPLTTDKKTLLRVNGAIHKQGSFMNAGHNNRYMLAPSLAFMPTDKLKLTLDMELYKEDVTRPYYISSYSALTGLKNIKDLPIDYKEAFFDNSLNAVSQNLRVYLNSEYKISKTWTSVTNIAYINEDLQKSYQGYLYFMPNDSLARSNGDFGPITTYSTDFQQNFKADFRIGSIRNRLLLGFDYYSYNSRRIYVSFPLLDTINYKTSFNLANIRKVEQAYNNYDNMVATSAYSSNFNQVAFYASDLINITPGLMVLASARADRYMLKGSSGYNQNSITPKFGIVYQPILEKISIFGNYTSGYTNAGTVTQPDGTQFVMKPYFAHQWEAGIKAALSNNHLVATLSYFDIRISDAPRYDGTGYAYQDGNQKSNGLEFDLKAYAFDGFSAIAGYVYNVNKYIKSTSNEGKLTTATPKNVGNLWLSYRFRHSPALKHFGIGAGGNYVDKSFFNAANTIILPSYLLVNASVFYDNETWRAGVAVANITNRKYWSSIATPQTPRNISLNVSFKF
ncbi:MAG: TonB-dependent siderophore receptor [Chitinophagaceae bacterium]